MNQESFNIDFLKPSNQFSYSRTLESIDEDAGPAQKFDLKQSHHQLHWFKVGLSPCKVCFICLNKSPLNDENAFYFTLKALSVLKKFKFLSWHFCLCGKQLDRETKVNFKISDATNHEQIIAIYIMPMIFSKDSQTIKFGQLIEYNMKNICHQKIMAGRETGRNNEAGRLVTELFFCF